MMYLGEDLFDFIPLGVCRNSWLYTLIFFHQIWEVFAIRSSNIFSASFFVSSSTGTALCRS